MKVHPNLGQQFTLLGIPVVVQQAPKGTASCTLCAFKATEGSRESCDTCDIDHHTLPPCWRYQQIYYAKVEA